jgi:hypothetical protein
MTPPVSLIVRSRAADWKQDHENICRQNQTGIVLFEKRSTVVALQSPALLSLCVLSNFLLCENYLAHSLLTP